MSTVLDRFSEQRRVIDINAIRADLVGAQFKHVDEWNADHRAIVACIGNLSLANGGSGAAPRAEQPVSAGGDRRKKRRHRCADGFVADDCRSIAEPKLRIRREELNEVICIPGIDNRKHALPPCTIGLRGTFWYGGDHCLQHTRRLGSVLFQG
jgi:hypothetical protein